MTVERIKTTVASNDEILQSFYAHGFDVADIAYNYYSSGDFGRTPYLSTIVVKTRHNQSRREWVCQYKRGVPEQEFNAPLEDPRRYHWPVRFVGDDE